MDVAASYAFDVATSYERAIPPEPWKFDPWRTADALAQTREQVVTEITRDVESALRDLRPLNEVYAHADTRLMTSVELDDVEPASPEGPARRGTFSYPGFSGYSPGGVFRKVVDRAAKKARRRQTHGLTTTVRALVVYLMGTKIAEDLLHPAHMDNAKAALDRIDPEEYGLDAIAFVVRAQPRGLAAIFTVADDTRLTEARVRAMFGQRRDS
jgi:hypothetical protein